MLTLPMFPYYTHSHNYWLNVVLEDTSTPQLGIWFRAYANWVVSQHVTDVDNFSLEEFFTFATPRHRTWFALKWS